MSDVPQTQADTPLRLDLTPKPSPPSEWPSGQAFTTFLLVVGFAAILLPFSFLFLLLAIPVAVPTYLAVRYCYAVARRRRQQRYAAVSAAAPSERDVRPLAAGEVALPPAPEVDPFRPRNPLQMRRGAWIAFAGFSGALACAAGIGLFPHLDAGRLDVLRRVCLIVFIFGLALVAEGNIRWKLRSRRLREQFSAAVLPADPVERKWIHGYLLLFPLLLGFLLWSFVLVTMTFGYLAISAASLYCLVRCPRRLWPFFLPAFAASLIWPIGNYVLLSIELPPLSYGRGQLTTAGWYLLLFELAAVVAIPAVGFFGRWVMDAVTGESANRAPRAARSQN